jgi:putative ABC transport system permease protein
MSQFLKDLAFGVRTLRRSPGFTFTAIVTLALGIGASTAIFSVVNAVLLRPLPYPHPERLVLLTADLTKRNVRDFLLSAGDFYDERRTSTKLDGLAGIFTGRLSLLADDGTPEAVPTAFVTADFFHVLGTPVTIGRDFEPTDGEIQPPPATPADPTVAAPPPVPNVTILSYEYWKRRYGGDRKVIGSIIRTTGGGSFLVVGIAPPGTEILLPPQFGVEQRPSIIVAARLNWSAPRNGVQLRAIGRLKPDATIAGAQGEVQALNTALDQQFPARLTSGSRLRIEPLHEDLVAEVKPAVLALMGGVSFVLLIACANVANLILVRTSRRERELAVRAALGGTRARLVRQMLAEALVLGAGGAALGLALAEGGVKLLIAIGPANLPRVSDVALDPFVLGFTIVSGLVAVALFGIVPALRASRPDMMGTLRSAGRSASLGSARALRNGVVIAEVMLAFVLLVGSGLMMRSFIALSKVDPGYDPDGLLVFNVQALGRSPDARETFIRVMRERLAAIPGVTGVTAAGGLPLDNDLTRSTGARWGTEAAVADPDKYHQGDFFIVQPGYFDVMKIKLVEGRAFTDADNVPTANSIIIDRTLAASAFPGESAIGKRLSVRFRTPEAEYVNVIGVVEHTRNASLSQPGRETYYVTEGEIFPGVAGRWTVRTAGDPARLETSVRAAIKAIDPLVLVTDMRPMSTSVDQARAPTRFALVLIAIFAAIAGVLSAVGLYGVLASVVRERTAEIGVRMALGAAQGGIFRLVIAQGLRLAAVGLVLGLLAALAMTRAMKSLLVGVSPTDPITFAAISVFFLGVAILACWLPARRAAGVDPVVALRAD